MARLTRQLGGLCVGCKGKGQGGHVRQGRVGGWGGSEGVWFDGCPRVKEHCVAGEKDVCVCVFLCVCGWWKSQDMATHHLNKIVHAQKKAGACKFPLLPG